MYQIQRVFLLLNSDMLTCEFERDECGQYFRIAQPGQYGAAIRWQRSRGRTPTERTGPDADHTRGDQNGTAYICGFPSCKLLRSIQLSNHRKCVITTH